MLKSYILYGLLFLALACSKIGTNLPEFNLVTLEGKNISSNELKGKIIVINVWATWCGPCIAELPELNALTEKYKNDTNVVFLALSDESAEKINNTLKKRSFNYIQIADAKALTNALQTRFVKTYPQHIVVAGNSEIKFDQSSGMKNVERILEAEIEKIKKKR